MRRSVDTKALGGNLTEAQLSLLARVRFRAVVFSGHERDEERLAMLQLYAAGLVNQFTNRARGDVMEWRITAEGRAVLAISNNKV